MKMGKKIGKNILAVMLIACLVLSIAPAGFALSGDPSELWVCPNCEKENSGNFCTNCGTPRPVESSTWICPDCGEENDGNFCSNCGRKAPEAGGEGQKKQEEQKEQWVQLFYGYYYESNRTERKMTVNGDGKVSETMTHTVPYSGPETLEVERNTFDSDGKIVSSETRDAGTGALTASETWAYDQEGRVLEILTRRADGTLSQKQSNSYADDGSVTEVESYDDNENLKSRSVTTKDRDGNVVRSESYDADGVRNSLRETSYDAEGRKISGENTTFIATGEDYTSTVSYEYDQNGLLNRSVEKHITGYYAGKTDVTTYTYDAWGNEVEEITLRDGEWYTSREYGWGLLKAGEITEVSGRTDFDSFDPAAYKGLNPEKSYGRISLTETQILNHDGVRVTAVSYSADGDSESVHIYAENSGNDKINLEIHTLQLNGKNTEPMSFYCSLEAHESKYSDIRLSPSLLKAAGIEKLESISVAMDMQVDYKTVFTSDTVRIPVRDQRTRVSGFVPMEKSLVDEDSLSIRIVGYDIQSTSFDVYYSIENHLEDEIRMEGNDTLFNGQAGSPYAQYTTVAQLASGMYISQFHNASYGKLDSVKAFEYSLLLKDGHYKELGKVEHIRWEFDAEGNLAGFSAEPFDGKISGPESAPSAAGSGASSSSAPSGGSSSTSSDTKTSYDKNGEKITEKYDANGKLTYKEEPYYVNGRKSGTLVYEAEITCFNLGETYTTPSSWIIPVMTPLTRLDRCLSFTLNMIFYEVDDSSRLGTQNVFYRVDGVFQKAGYLEMEHVNTVYSMDFNLKNGSKIDGFAMMPYFPKHSGSYSLGCYLTDVYYVK